MFENGKIRFSRCKKFKAVKADYGYRSIIWLRHNARQGSNVKKSDNQD